ncbi:YnfU family zinc-binding protein [Chimaeribacter arupi]|nr:YnfU family zinc-binding protein [Chimaeribacter arupi]WKZ94256.1 YnfU family zinc-binding protein [Chimaeribacter arupi]
MDHIANVTSTAKCPICGKSSKQSITKISREQTMICPYCNSLFVRHHKLK